MSASSTLAEALKLETTFSSLQARFDQLTSDRVATEGTRSTQCLQLLSARASALRDEFAAFSRHRSAVLANLSIFQACEFEPLREQANILQEKSDAILQRLHYLGLWAKGETTAPVLEVLLYFVIPVSHLEALAGDLEEEYRTIQIPRRGPRAAQWWYTRHVLKTITCYATRACKQASIVISAVGLLRRIAHWLSL